MGWHGRQWEPIVNVWDFGALRHCGKSKSASAGTKHDRILDEAIISQDIAAKRCSFSVLAEDRAARILAQDLVGKKPDGL
jgi:competence transcription factor ComK